jgi:hypothetical protein
MIYGDEIAINHEIQFFDPTPGPSPNLLLLAP